MRASKIMRASKLFTATLAVAAVLAQAGCSRDSELSEQETATSEKASGAAGTAAAPKPSTQSVTLPEGTVLTVRTTNTLSTKTQQAGQTFSAHLEEPVVHGGREIAPKGAVAQGTIVESDQGGRVKGVAILTVRLTELHAANGRQLDISTNSISIHADTTKGKDAAKIGIGSGVGAAIGAIAGGGKGAAIGAAAGAGAGTGVVLATTGDAAVIPSETVLIFSLRSPVVASR
jgi:hypothetical protein